jgi:hypothetical protein
VERNIFEWINLYIFHFGGRSQKKREFKMLKIGDDRFDTYLKKRAGRIKAKKVKNLVLIAR